MLIQWPGLVTKDLQNLCYESQLCAPSFFLLSLLLFNPETPSCKAGDNSPPGL